MSRRTARKKTSWGMYRYVPQISWMNYKWKCYLKRCGWRWWTVATSIAWYFFTFIIISWTKANTKIKQFTIGFVSSALHMNDSQIIIRDSLVISFHLIAIFPFLSNVFSFFLCWIVRQHEPIMNYDRSFFCRRRLYVYKRTFELVSKTTSFS